MHCKSIIVGFLLSLLCLQMSYSQKDSLQAVCLAHLNSSENDHSIWAGKDFILFTSDRNSHFAGKNPENGLYYEQIYISEKHQQYLTKPRLKKFSLARNHYGIAGQSDNPSVVLLYTGQDEEGEILLIRVNEGKKRWKAQKILFSPEMQKIRKTSAFLNEKTGELFICAEIGDDTFEIGRASCRERV